MDFVRNHKTTMIGVGLVIVLFVGYAVFFAGSDDESALVVSGRDDGSLVGREIVVLLSQLQGITLDTTILDSDAFDGLIDYNKPVAPQPVGRANPFAPIGQ